MAVADAADKTPGGRLRHVRWTYALVGGSAVYDAHSEISRLRLLRAVCNGRFLQTHSLAAAGAFRGHAKCAIRTLSTIVNLSRVSCCNVSCIDHQ
jgi:hypothetical protein